jgi:hypothetical protein
VADERHALLITSSVYNDSQLQSLATPADDAKLLGGILRQRGVGAFKVRQTTNPVSWRAAQAVEDFFANRDYDDVLLLYFSGHGLKSDDGELYFATRNTRRGALRSTSLPASFVRDVMHASRSQRQVLVLDCCYGGAFAQTLAKSDQAVDVTERLQGFGTVVLTASNSLEFAWQDEESSDLTHRMSVFTGVLVEGLRDGSADVDGDGRITVKELFEYVSKRVRLIGAQQTPTLSSVGQEGELVIARAKVHKERIAGLTIDLSPHVTIRNSGAEGSVVGLALAVAMEASLDYQGRKERLSARYGYAKAQVLDGGTGLGPHEGASIASGLKAARSFGLPLESAWPYIASEPSLPQGETWEAMDAARPRFRARFRPISTYEEIPYHLLRGRPVLTGVAVFQDGWYNKRATTTGWVKLSRSRQMVGGHAIVIVGYDSANDALKFANSWGAGWGDAGFGYLPRRAVEQALAARTLRGSGYWAVEVPLNSRYCLGAAKRR